MSTLKIRVEVFATKACTAKASCSFKKYTVLTPLPALSTQPHLLCHLFGHKNPVSGPKKFHKFQSHSFVNNHKHFTIICTIATYKPVGKSDWYLIECYTGTFQVAIENGIEQNLDATNAILVFLDSSDSKGNKEKKSPLGRTLLSVSTKLLL